MYSMQNSLFQAGVRRMREKCLLTLGLLSRSLLIDCLIRAHVGRLSRLLACWLRLLGVAHLLGRRSRLFLLGRRGGLLWNPIDSGQLAWRHGSGEARTHSDNSDGDQQKKDDQRGPLCLLEAPIERPQGDNNVCAHKEDQELRNAIAKEVSCHQRARPAVAPREEE